MHKKTKYRYINILPFLLAAIFLQLTTYSKGQSYKQINKIFDRIQVVPWYPSKLITTPTAKKSIESKRDYYIEFLLLDTAAVPFLIDKLTDTSFSRVINSCTQKKLRKCELALYLLKTIDKFDERLLTGIMWDDFDDCGLCSISFRLYFANNKAKVQDQYRKYFSSKERQQVLKERIN